MKSGNRGEWSELYVLLKLLGDKIIYSGDSNLDKNINLFYPIIKILREETENSFNYNIDNNLDIVIISSPNEEIRVPIVKFKEKAKFLFDKIKSSKDTTFVIPEIEQFMQEIMCNNLKAKSTSKSDIKVVIHDLRTNMTPTLGFSIKSQLGSPSTLLNAGRTTNFIYKILPNAFNHEHINEINSINKFKEKLNKILSLGYKIEYIDLENQIFKNNLILIDSLMPEIIANMLLIYYSTSESKIEKVLDIINYNNPLKFNNTYNHSFYEYKLRKFLTDVALGMTPAKVWSGKYDATGGYLIVKENSDVICYHIYNKNEFEDYLLKNTRFETASTSRHEFGEIYNQENNSLIKLNLQIRFIK